MLALDNIQGFLIQLACAGGSGAIAKTAVAPLERVKVSGHGCRTSKASVRCNAVCGGMWRSQAVSGSCAVDTEDHASGFQQRTSSNLPPATGQPHHLHMVMWGEVLQSLTLHLP